MAILTALPSQAIIAGFKGVIDYYLWMDIPVARTWPRPPTGQRSTAVKAQWPAFTLAVREWNHLSPIVQAAYRALAQNSGLDGRDLQVRAYLSGLYRYPTP